MANLTAAELSAALQSRGIPVVLSHGTLRAERLAIREGSMLAATDSAGVPVVHQTVDFVLPAGDYSFGEDETACLPLEAHRFECSLEAGPRTFRPLVIAGQVQFRFVDDARLWLRIHCKEVAS